LFSCSSLDEHADIGGTTVATVRRPGTLRRGVAIGTAVLLAAAALLPWSANAAISTSSAAGVVNNVTRALSAGDVRRGDVISVGWALSMPGKHAAATVEASDIVATIPLRCQSDDSHPRVTSLVVHLGDATLSFAANATAWQPTASPASANGYQVSMAVGDICHDGELEPYGRVTYQATLVSTDTTDLFSMRFHSVDARTNQTKSKDSDDRDDDDANANINCSSTSQNARGVGRCNAAWTSETTISAAPATTPTGGSGGGPSGGSPPAAPYAPPAVATRPSTAAHVSGPSKAHSSSAAQAAPVLISPAPSQPTVLGPVPLVVPVSDGAATRAGVPLAWNWFALLAILNLGLIVGVVIRRRRARIDRLNGR